MVALRIPTAMSFGVLVSVGLFALLASLVNGDQFGKPMPTVPFPNFTTLTLPPPIAPPVRPPQVELTITELPPGPRGPDLPDTDIGRPGRGERPTALTFGTPDLPTGTATVGIDRDPLPVVRVDPDYPVRECAPFEAQSRAGSMSNSL